jgi:hypothetical protein
LDSTNFLVVSEQLDVVRYGETMLNLEAQFPKERHDKLESPSSPSEDPMGTAIFLRYPLDGKRQGTFS